MVPQVAQVLDDRAFRNVEVLAGDRLDDLLMVSHCFATNLRGELEVVHRLGLAMLSGTGR